MGVMRFETERLVLRSWQEVDLEDLTEIITRPDVIKWFLTDGEPKDRKDVWRFIAYMMGHWQMRGFGFFAVEEKSSGKLVGRVGPWMPEGWPQLEVGWTISHDFRGKGYAVEAARAAIWWVFENLEVDQIVSIIDPDNHASARVALKVGERLGWHGDFEGLPFDYYEITRDMAQKSDWYETIVVG